MNRLRLAFLLPGLLLASETVEVTFFVPPLRGILTEDSAWSQPPGHLVAMVDGEPDRVRLIRNHYSRPLTLARGTPMRLFHASGTGQPGERYLEVDLPEDASHLLLVLHPETGGEQTDPRVEVFEIDPEAVPAGWHTFLNRLDHIVTLTVDGNEYNIDPGRQVSFQTDQPRSRFFLEELSGKRGRRCTGAVYTVENQAMLHVIDPDPNSARRIDVRAFRVPGASE